ncbi:ABC-2 type transport system ATP-binding protein [Cyclonatronum proteinivorum]|uniref:ABC-2 type transport system ATP-binding protein n=1 Tax=Cyclonatronum proteinivorum TaxID=1457365 RepID=A0A345UPH6_9BACT|nr:ATP-binding cassette domain-containing protein [Cyclonatronum proteinivorum]AXJ02378.1 ABC-2 type transport system ATP-binding protein [Cyclonatronum proteinivorum]
MESVLRLSGLTKNYGGIRALDGVSMAIPQGAVFGLLGPNGSGKTTLLSLITGLAHRTSGSFIWQSVPENTPSPDVAAIIEKPNFLPKLRAAEQLSHIARLRGLGEAHRRSEIPRLLEKVGLSQAADRPLQAFSLGMKQRFGIAALLLSDPRVLILDEPTNGLDPQGIIEIRHLILQLAAEGRTIILASHLLDEVEKVCTHAAILKQGRLLDVREMRADSAGGSGEAAGMLVELGVAPEQLPALFPLLDSFGAKPEAATGLLPGRVQVRLKPGADPAALNRFLSGHEIYLAHLQHVHDRLETSFLKALENRP